MEDFRLRVFMQVVESGSFTKASYALGVSQPAVSQNISEIEKSYGVPLFERSRASVSLTDAGKVFLHYARFILDQYKGLGQAMDYWKSVTSGTSLRIYVPDVLAGRFGSEMIPFLRSLNPTLEMTLVGDPDASFDIDARNFLL